ncbi:MAG: DUF4257 domain-containing protein [Chloroflexota bacterium]|nr:DUF4257 domain-containing protein [Chloroflexota bacterium]
MKKRALAVLLLAGILLLVVAPLALAQTPDPARSPTPVPMPVPTRIVAAPTGGLDTKYLADTMTQGDFRLVLVLTLVFGGLGGLVYELMVLQGSVEQPHRVKEGGWVYDLGVIGRMLMGAMAAVAALFVISPEDAYKLVAVSVIAGASASAIFKSLQARVEAMVAQQAVVQAQETTAQIADKAEQMADALGITETGLNSTRGIRGVGAPSTESERRAAQLLSEIRALSSMARKPKKEDSGL